MRAFIVYVRPIVEYCSVVWSPCLKQDIDSVEKVQRRFTKRLKGLKSMPYADRLRYLGVPSLELRRLHLDLIYCYRIVFGLVDLNLCDFFQLSLVSKTRGHPYKLYKTHCGGARSRFFAERVINIWNGLPATVNFSSLSSFKSSIGRVDLSEFIKCI